MKQQAETGCWLARDIRGLGGKVVVRKRMRKGDRPGRGLGRRTQRFGGVYKAWLQDA